MHGLSCPTCKTVRKEAHQIQQRLAEDSITPEQATTSLINAGATREDLQRLVPQPKPIEANHLLVTGSSDEVSSTSEQGMGKNHEANRKKRERKKRSRTTEDRRQENRRKKERRRRRRTAEGERQGTPSPVDGAQEDEPSDPQAGTEASPSRCRTPYFPTRQHHRHEGQRTSKVSAGTDEEAPTQARMIPTLEIGYDPSWARQVRDGIRASNDSLWSRWSRTQNWEDDEGPPCRCDTAYACVRHKSPIDVDANHTTTQPSNPKQTKPHPPIERLQIDRSPSRPELEQWIENKGITLGTCIPSEQKLEVMQTLWTYRELESTGLETLGPPTHLITHRMRIREGTPIYRARGKMMARDKEWWYRKFAIEGMESGMFERTVQANGRLSQWGADPVIINRPGKTPRLTFNYHYVWEEPPGNQMQLSRDAHAFLSLPSHRSLSQFDLKNSYWLVQIHPDDRHYLAFSVPGIGQLQPTRMPQGARSSSFTMNELGNIAFGTIETESGTEPSFLHNPKGPEHPPDMTFYIDDMLIAHEDWATQWKFLRDHFLPRLRWANLKLSLGKVQIGVTEMLALGEVHQIGGKISPKPERVRKLLDWPVPQTPSDVRGFLGTAILTRRWIRNYAELARPLTRLTSRKAEWSWGDAEELAFTVIKNKAADATLLHGWDPTRPVEMFVDASKFAAGCFIRQRQGNVLVPVLYDSFPFSATERNYDTYKRELKAMVTFAQKHAHMLTGPHRSTIWTDHQPLTGFLKGNNHSDIFFRWLEKLRPYNIGIQHIEGKRNTAADGLSRTIFPGDCEATETTRAVLQEARKRDTAEDHKWFWKSGKGGYEEMLRERVKKESQPPQTIAAVVNHIQTSGWVEDHWPLHVEANSTKRKRDPESGFEGTPCSNTEYCTNPAANFRPLTFGGESYKLCHACHARFEREKKNAAKESREPSAAWKIPQNQKKCGIEGHRTSHLSTQAQRLRWMPSIEKFACAECAKEMPDEQGALFGTRPAIGRFATCTTSHGACDTTKCGHLCCVSKHWTVEMANQERLRFSNLPTSCGAKGTCDHLTCNKEECKHWCCRHVHHGCASKHKKCDWATCNHSCCKIWTDWVLRRAAGITKKTRARREDRGQKIDELDGVHDKLTAYLRDTAKPDFLTTRDLMYEYRDVVIEIVGQGQRGGMALKRGKDRQATLRCENPKTKTRTRQRQDHRKPQKTDNEENKTGPADNSDSMPDDSDSMPDDSMVYYASTGAVQAEPQTESSTLTTHSDSLKLTDDDWARLDREWYEDLRQYHQHQVTPTSMTKPEAYNFARRAKHFRYDAKAERLERRLPTGDWVLCVHPRDIAHILKEAHDDSGHFTSEVILTQLRNRLYWPTQNQDVMQYVRSCYRCAMWADFRKNEALRSLDSLQPWELVQADLMGEMPMSTRQNKYLLVLVCCFSNFVMAKPLKAKSDVPAALIELFQALVNPAALVSDIGNEFESAATRAVLADRGIYYRSTAAYNKRPTGAIENVIKILRRASSKKLPLYKNAAGHSYARTDEWDLAAMDAVQAMNGRYIKTLGFSPAEITLGHKPDGLFKTNLSYPTERRRAIVEMVSTQQGDVSEGDLPLAGLKLIDRREQIRLEAGGRIGRTREFRMARFDNSLQDRPVQVGDWVFAMNKKWTGATDVQWSGPYLVTGYTGDHDKSVSLQDSVGKEIHAPNGRHLADLRTIQRRPQRLRPPK